MARFGEKIVGIMKPYAQKHKVDTTSAWEGYIRDIGRDLDKEKKTIAEAMILLERRCEYRLDREDKRDILRSLERIA